MAAGTGLGLSSAFPSIKFRAINRTDQVTEIGRPYWMIMGQNDSEPEEMGLDALYSAGSPTDDITANFIRCRPRQSQGIHAIALQAVGDNEECVMLLKGITLCHCWVIPVNPIPRGSYLIHDFSTAIGGGEGGYFRYRAGVGSPNADCIALQDVPPNAENGQSALTWCMWDGLNGFAGFSDIPA